MMITLTDRQRQKQRLLTHDKAMNQYFKNVLLVQVMAKRLGTGAIFRPKSGIMNGLRS